MTQEELAVDVKVDKSCVCHWETGRTSPRAKLIPRIAKSLKVPVSRLYGEAA